MKTLHLLLALGLMCNFQLLWGQCIDISPTCIAQQPFVQHFENDVTLTSALEINLAWPGATSASWGFCEGLTGDCTDAADFSTSITFAGGLTISSPSASQVTVTGTPTTNGIYNIIVQADIPILPDPVERHYQFIVREPLHLAFVVDKSGSMGGTTPTSSSSKWTMAQDAIWQFANALSSDVLSLVDGDRLSLIGFDGDEAIPALPIAVFRPVSEFVDTATSFFVVAEGGFTPGGSTSIGDGMAHSVEDLHGGLDANLRQATVLISDGMQNADAMVTLDGEKLAGGGIELLNTPGAIDTYTIGFTHSDSPGPHEQLLINISSSVTNENYFYTLDEGMYTPSFAEIFARVFNQFSPQLVDMRLVELPPPPTQGYSPIEETFPVNANASKLLLQVSFNQDIAGFFGYEILKDGLPLNAAQYGQFIGNGSSLFTINFQEQPQLGGAGQWTIRASDVPTGTELPIRAIFSATVDEHSFRGEYEVLNDPTIAEVGQAQVNTRLRPEARLSLRGQPLEGALVTARLIEPGADKGTLVATNFADFSVDSTSNPYSAKFRALQEQEADVLESLYEFAENEIKLDDDGGGLYTGRFGKLNVADNVSVIFRVLYQDSVLGTIQRYYRSSVAVRFGELDHNLGAVGSAFLDENVYRLEYRPQYFNGSNLQLVGPGYGPTLRAQNGDILDVEDEGDGTYIIHVQVADLDTEVDLFLLDEPIYTGSLADFAKPPLSTPYELSFHLGYAFPLASSGLLDSLDNGGLLVEFDFGFQVAPRWSIELIGGYYDYQPNDYLLGAGLHARYRWLNPGARYNWTAAAGVGYYARDAGNGVVGIGVRAGAEYQLSKTILLTGELGTYFFDEVSNMGLIALGAKYRF